MQNASIDISVLSSEQKVALFEQLWSDLEAEQTPDSQQEQQIGIDARREFVLLHSRFQTYLREVSERSQISIPEGANLGECFRLLVARHPAFTTPTAIGSPISVMAEHLVAAIDALRPLHSLDIEDDRRLGEPEAIFAGRCLGNLHGYLIARTSPGQGDTMT